jgi:hypothetical protein
MTDQTTSRPIIARILLQFPPVSCMTQAQYIVATDAALARMRARLGADVTLHSDIEQRGHTLQATVSVLMPLDAGGLSNSAAYDEAEQLVCAAATLPDGNTDPHLLQMVHGEHLVGQPITLDD